MKTFVRDHFTWLAYLMLAYYAYMQASLGPAMPFVRSELSLNYTVLNFHLSAFALGMMLAGLTADVAARRLGRGLVFWGGGGGMIGGALLLVAGRSPMMTIGGAFVMGLIGSYLLVMIQATLSDRHLAQRAIALTEANVLASVSAALAPALVALGQTLHLTWRLALYAGAVSWIIMLLTSRRVALPVEQKMADDTEPHGALPRSFWAYWLVVFLSVAVEWCMIFWAADFLEKAAGLSKELASASISLFFVASVIGRWSGSRLSRRFDGGKLLLMAGGIVVVGFPVFWLSRAPLLNVLGLFICGLGIANLYPLTLSVATAVAPRQSNTASGRISMASGTAIFIAPQVLASTADQIGIQNAYGIVAGLIIGVIIVTVFANRLAQERQMQLAESGD